MPIKLNIPLPSKGLVVDRPGEFVDSRSATNTKNVEVNRNAVRKRPGTVALGASMGERVMRLFELQIGAQNRLIRIGPTEVEGLTKATSTWASVTSTALTGTLDDIVSCAFPNLSGERIAVFTNGKDAIRKIAITGNDSALGGTPPLSRYVRAFGPYLVLAYVTDGGNTYTSRVQWSDTGDPETWSGGNTGSVDLIEDPEDITGLGLFGNYLTVHKRASIYIAQLVTTSDVFRFERKPTGVGTVAEATIASLPTGEQIFLGVDGIHIFNGITAPLIEAPIQDEIRESLNPGAAHRACGMYVDQLDEYWCAVPVGSSENPDIIYKYNARTGVIYKDERPGMTAFSLYINTTEDTWDAAVGTWDTDTERWDSTAMVSLNKLVVFGDADGVTTRRDSSASSDASAAIAANFETKDFTAADFGIPDFDAVMRWKGLELWATGNDLDVEYSTDGGASWVSAGDHPLTSYFPSDGSPLRVYFDVVGSSLRLRFLNNEAGETFLIKKYRIDATPSGVRK